MNALDIALNIGVAAVTVAVVLCAWRLLRGPEMTDRLLALDTLYMNAVALIVLPYLLLPNDWYVAAFVIMIAVVVLVILFFNYYVSVAQSLPFWKRFGEMVLISLGVAALSFAIGLAAKALLGVNVA